MKKGKEIVRYYRSGKPCGWHVAYLESIARPRKGSPIAVLIPIIPGKNRIRIPLADVVFETCAAG